MSQPEPRLPLEGLDDKAPAGAEPTSEMSAEARLVEVEARQAELADAYLRAKADAENTRRRSEEEIAKARKYAVEGFAEDLLPVKDSLEAALALPDATAEQMLEACTPLCVSSLRHSNATRSPRSTRPRRRSSIRTSIRPSASYRQPRRRIRW